MNLRPSTPGRSDPARRLKKNDTCDHAFLTVEVVVHKPVPCTLYIIPFPVIKENIFRQTRKIFFYPRQYDSINYSNNLSYQKKMPILDRTRSFSFSRVIFYENCQILSLFEIVRSRENLSSAYRYTL